VTDGAGMDWRFGTSTILVMVEKKVLQRSRAVAFCGMRRKGRGRNQETGLSKLWAVPWAHCLEGSI
jgi:hypothetical protein